MKKLFAALLLVSVMCSFALAEPVKHGQCYTASELTTLDKQDVAGGKGTLHGEFSFIRDNARDEDAIKEIGLMTLKPGDSIGLHKHADNEDTYIILSGKGIFTDGDGEEYMVGPMSVTIATPGEAHALKNTGNEDLIFIDLIAQNHALKK